MVGAHKGLQYEVALSSRQGQCRSRRFEPKELCQYPCNGGFPQELVENLRELRLEIVPRGFVAALEIQSTLLGKN